ncbi:uncharacterized protein [Cardiocondyla obscurior]|uniref:uncharacterized protein n=1 Tax=Cardiocondyla obscurior TaxID=286306 RepID=UPI00396581A6
MVDLNVIMDLSDEEKEQDGGQNVLMDLDLSDDDDNSTLSDDSDYVSDQTLVVFVHAEDTAYKMDFYVPAVASTSSSTSYSNNVTSTKQRTTRLLSRRYALTATSYKYLEIGVNVGSQNYVEIAIGDTRGHEIVLSLEAWKSLCEYQENILNLLHNKFRNPEDFVQLGSVSARLYTMNNLNLLRLESNKVHILMTESTYHRMLTLDDCITLTFDRMTAVLNQIDVKYAQFANIASAVKNQSNVVDAIRVSNLFDRNQFIDCELLALVFSI